VFAAEILINNSAVPVI